jgi:hypothetical protein
LLEEVGISPPVSWSASLSRDQREEVHTFAVQEQGGPGVALAIDRSHHVHGVDMSHNILCGKDRLDVLVLAGEAAAQMRCGFGDGQIIGRDARLRYDEVGSRWAALDLVVEALFQTLRADNVDVGILCVQSVSVSMRSR